MPSGGSRFLPYYRPTPNLASNNIYYPGQEQLGPGDSATPRLRVAGMDTVLGPVFLSYGHAEQRNDGIYLYPGRLFLIEWEAILSEAISTSVRRTVDKIQVVRTPQVRIVYGLWAAGLLPVRLMSPRATPFPPRSWDRFKCQVRIPRTQLRPHLGDREK